MEQAEVEAHREAGRGDDGGETQLVAGVRGWEPWAGQGSRWVRQQTVAGWAERHEGQDANKQTVKKHVNFNKTWPGTGSQTLEPTLQHSPAYEVLRCQTWPGTSPQPPEPTLQH